jgi:alpha-tubulin suppressor-like RCC1 family protein
MRRILLAVLACLVFVAPASAQVYQNGTYIGASEELTNAFPTEIAGSSGAEEVAASNGASYFRIGCKEYAVGGGEDGAVGNDEEVNEATPVEVKFPAGVCIAHIGEAKNEGYAIDTTGQGWSWGGNAEGDGCAGKGGKTDLPVKVPAITSGVQVAGGSDHVMWLLSSGAVFACGRNKNGELCREGVKSSKVPLLIEGLPAIVEIKSGDTINVMRTASGEVWTCGNDETGAVGNGKTGPAVYVPYHVPLSGAASEVSGGGDLSGTVFALAVVEGEVVGWGGDGKGQIGDGSKTNKLSPVGTGLHYPDVAASGGYTLALTSAGVVDAWGANTGDAMGAPSSLTPELVFTGAAAISGTAEDTLILAS